MPEDGSELIVFPAAGSLEGANGGTQPPAPKTAESRNAIREANARIAQMEERILEIGLMSSTEATWRTQEIALLRAQIDAEYTELARKLNVLETLRQAGLL